MNLTVYNTLDHAVRPFQEIEKGKIGLYTCGPTVYDYPHIGNFRSYVFEDLVKRYLLMRGFQVLHVMNITDIEDKIIRRANQEGVTISEISRKFTEAFFEDRDRLRILPADVYPRATEHIEEMVAIIETLLEKGIAYQKDGSVYFSIARFPAYGRLANLDKEKMRVGVRVDLDEYDKEEVQDFVLWKGRKGDEPFWTTRIGEGRPGWHIECSAMSGKYLGTHFDIHMGGVDNIFPHHENEIAQTEAATGETFVNYWIHCQHLIVDNQKMSKSLGNFYTLRDLLQKGYDPMAIRYLLLSTHYRKLLNFSFEGLERAAQALQRMRNFAFSLQELTPPPGKTAAVDQLVAAAEQSFFTAMDDDFNISGALGAFFDFIHAVNSQVDSLKTDDVTAIQTLLRRINSVLGILDLNVKRDLESEILARIEERQAARKAKDFARSDRIRDELKARGIILMDTPEGVKWRLDQQ